MADVHPPHPQVLAELIQQLDLERLEQNLFRGSSRDLGNRSLFGGQVIGQALMAAQRTVEGRSCHSLHAYFLLPGDAAAPLVYDVDRLRDGSSFSARRVQAIQHGRPIFSMIVSFQIEESGYTHQATMPDVPPPEQLKSIAELRDAWIAAAPPISQRAVNAMNHAVAVEFKPVKPWNPLAPTIETPDQAIWFRTVAPIGDDPLLHRAMLAYASDFNLIGTATRPHGESWYSPRLLMASLDHALWFHRDFRMDDWLLYAMDSPSAAGARGFTRGQIYTRDGTLVASVAQEGLIRPVPEKKV